MNAILNRSPRFSFLSLCFFRQRPSDPVKSGRKVLPSRTMAPSNNEENVRFLSCSSVVRRRPKPKSIPFIVRVSFSSQTKHTHTHTHTHHGPRATRSASHYEAQHAEERNPQQPALERRRRRGRRCGLQRQKSVNIRL